METVVARYRNGPYIEVRLASGRRSYEHRWVYEQAHGKLPDGWDVHHRSGIKDDNHLQNLEATPHAAHSSYHRKGMPYRAFTPEQLLYGVQMYRAGLAYWEASVVSGVNQQSIEREVRRRGWNRTAAQTRWIKQRGLAPEHYLLAK